MRVVIRIVNFFITGGVLFLTSRIFPRQVRFDSLWVLVLITLLLWLMEVIIMAVGFFISAFGTLMMGAGAANGCLLVIAGMIVMPFAKVAALYALDAIFDEFTMEGFWIKLLVAVVCSILCIQVRREEYYY